MLQIMRNRLIFLMLFTALLGLGACENDSDVGALNSSGQGGSLARFTIAGNYLYVVDDNTLLSFLITDGKLSITDTYELNFGVETIFPYQGNLFIGSIDALYIFDLRDPSSPEFVSEFQHEVSCDPVVVQGNYAYVSLRLTGCNQRILNSVVEILDVSNINNPKLVSSYFDVETPYGLGIKDDVLYVCQNRSGLLLLDVSDRTDPQPIKTLSINAYDVIINGNTMILVGDDGLAQYDITTPQNPLELSLLPTE